MWVRAVIEGRPFEVWGGEQLRDFTYVDDVVEAMLAAADQDSVLGRTLNIGGDRVISLRDTADLLVAATGPSARYDIREFPAERKKIDIGDYYAADDAFRAATGWAPAVPLEAGLARTIAFYREHLSRYL